MSNDNKNNEDQEINTTALHNLMFFIIIVLLLAILYFAYHAYYNTEHPKALGSLQHYDSLYSNREWHVSMDPSGENVTGYTAPDGTYYTFQNPIPTNTFRNPDN